MPFWFSAEHHLTALMPFWLSADKRKSTKNLLSVRYKPRAWRLKTNDWYVLKVSVTSTATCKYCVVWTIFDHRHYISWNVNVVLWFEGHFDMNINSLITKDVMRMESILPCWPFYSCNLWRFPWGNRCERGFEVTPTNLSWKSDGGTEKGPLVLHVTISLSLNPAFRRGPVCRDSLERSYLFYDRPSRLSSNAPACRGQSRLSGFCCAQPALR